MLNKLLFLPVFLCIFIFAAPLGCAQNSSDSVFKDPTAPDSFKVAFTTSKGNVIVRVYRSWSPQAADRFYNLVTTNYYDSIVIFRVVKDFVAQFGLSNKPEQNEFYQRNGIQDEPVKAPNKRGTLVFARAGKNSRSNQLFFNLKDNDFLNTTSYGGTTGFPAFGKVIAGMNMVDSFCGEYGEQPTNMQQEIAQGGIRYIRSLFPNLDFIISARLLEE